MVEFAGYCMPVQFEGIMAEHLWTRENAGLFDVSHMGQVLIHGRNADGELEALLPGDLKGLADRKLRYSMLLDDSGGIIDDLMATRRGEDFYLVVNGATKHGDLEVMRQGLPDEIVVDHMKDRRFWRSRARRPSRRSTPLSRACPG
jgi:aminomethyltransferase